VHLSGQAQGKVRAAQKKPQRREEAIGRCEKQSKAPHDEADPRHQSMYARRTQKTLFAPFK
jgi:hypothetical protein